jgi:DNA-binding NarL/FixJ family response regulator
MSESKIRVALVEDFPDIRAELAALIAMDNTMEPAGVCASGEEAFELLPKTNPDVVLMDIGLPGISGVECVRLLRPLIPFANFLMLTIFKDHEQVHAALKAGATGYLLKGVSWDRLCGAIHELHAGESPISSSIARELIRTMVGGPVNRPEEGCISLREEEILRSLAQGRRYKEIAVDFGLSVHTVRTHIHRIYKKLHVQSKMEAVNVFRRQPDSAARTPPQTGLRL